VNRLARIAVARPLQYVDSKRAFGFSFSLLAFPFFAGFDFYLPPREAMWE
jgi:hypothetical protein